MDKPDTDRNKVPGEPPGSTRFKPGRSGNPKGRPKVGDDPASVFHAVMDMKVAITVNGRPRKVGTVEAVFLRLRQEALNGDPQARKQILEWLGKHPKQSEPLSDPTPADLNELFEQYATEDLVKFRQFSAKEEAMRNQKRKRRV